MSIQFYITSLILLVVVILVISTRVTYRVIKQELRRKRMNQDFTKTNPDATLDLENNLMKEEEMPSKFYNFQCITLYAYIDFNVAVALTATAQLNEPITHLINTPLELYESEYMARLLAPKTGKKQLIAFAINVENNIFDEFDLALEERIKKDGRSADTIMQSVDVIRQYKKYKPDNSKSVRPYISYIIQNQNAIKQVFPL